MINDTLKIRIIKGGFIDPDIILQNLPGHVNQQQRSPCCQMIDLFLGPLKLTNLLPANCSSDRWRTPVKCSRKDTKVHSLFWIEVNKSHEDSPAKMTSQQSNLEWIRQVTSISRADSGNDFL